MTTSYSMTDTLPKDAGGAKHLGLINDQTSQLDYALLRGVGAESLGGTSKNVAFMGVGSHTAGSAVGTKIGVMSAGLYAATPTAVGDNTAQLMRVDKQGALFIRGAQTSYSQSGASVQTHVAGSALLHGYSIRLNDVNAGDRVNIENGTAFVMSIIANSASQNFVQNFSTGILFSTSLVHRLTMSGAGTASVTLFYSQ